MKVVLGACKSQRFKNLRRKKMKRKKVGRPKGSNLYDRFLPQISVTDEMYAEIDGLFPGELSSLSAKVRRILVAGIKYLSEKKEDRVWKEVE